MQPTTVLPNTLTSPTDHASSALQFQLKFHHPERLFRIPLFERRSGTSPTHGYAQHTLLLLSFVALTIMMWTIYLFFFLTG